MPRRLQYFQNISSSNFYFITLSQFAVIIFSAFIGFFLITGEILLVGTLCLLS